MVSYCLKGYDRYASIVIPVYIVVSPRQRLCSKPNWIEGQYGKDETNTWCLRSSLMQGMKTIAVECRNVRRFWTLIHVERRTKDTCKKLTFTDHERWMSHILTLSTIADGTSPRLLSGTVMPVHAKSGPGEKIITEYCIGHCPRPDSPFYRSASRFSVSDSCKSPSISYRMRKLDA